MDCEIPHDPQLHINNITATFTVRQCIKNMPLNLPLLARNMYNCEYNPAKFSAIIMRQREPYTTTLIFASGKCVLIGSKSIRDAKRASFKFTSKIARVQPVKLVHFEIQNIASSFTMQHVFVNLASITRALTPYFATTFEPELFPAMMINFFNVHNNLKQTKLLVYRSGKVVITGLKIESCVVEAFNLVYPHLIKLQTQNVSLELERALEDGTRWEDAKYHRALVGYFKNNVGKFRPKIF